MAGPDLRAAQFDLLLAPVDEVSLRFTHDGVDGTTLDWGMWVQPHGDPDPGAAVATAVLTPGVSETTGTLDVSALELGVDHLVVLRVGSGWAMGRCVRSRLTTVRQVHEVQLSLAEVGVDLTVVVSPGGDGRVEVFAAALAVPVPVEGLGGSFDGDTLTVPALDQVPEGVRVLTIGQTDPARDGMWTSEGSGVFSWEVERWQPFRPENAGLLVTAVTSTTGEPVRGVIATVDGETFFVDPIGSDVELPIGMEDVSGLSDALAGKADSSALDGFVPRSSAPLFLSDFADPTGTASASDGMRAALAQLAAQGGGELVIDGLFLLDQNSIIVGEGASFNFTGQANSVVIRGQGSRSALICGGGGSTVCLQIGGLDSLLIEHVTFFGSQSTIPDVRCALYLPSNRTATLLGCNFIGIVAGAGATQLNGAVLRSHATNLVLKSTNFLACGGQISSWHGGEDTAVVLSTASNGFTAEDCRWHDVIHGAHFRGAPQAFKRQGIAWVWIREPQLVGGGTSPTHSRAISFRNCQMDEATACGILVDDSVGGARHRLVEIENCNIATPSVATTPHALDAPVLLKRVDTVLVRNTSVGYFGSKSVGMRFEDCADVTIDGAHGWDPATTIEADEHCGTLRVSRLSGTLTTVDSHADRTVRDGLDTAPRRVATLAANADFSLQAAYGTLATRMDTTSTFTTAINPGNELLSYGYLWAPEELSRLIFEITASSLAEGEAINVVCRRIARNGLPGPIAWVEPVPVGDLVDVVPHDFAARLPRDGYTLGIHNPAGNAGSVTVRSGRPIDGQFMGFGAVAMWSGVIASPGAEPAVDMGGFAVHSSPNTPTRLGLSQTAPIILLR